ncbi:hypothetical protein [Paenibacillus sp. MMS18-CY102]|uniref:hypothetical protein n=1 Tax=Paenibacillus sp. MMS18-CY102 TaxID=2682849 RepID=UPI0013657913|nr:hypothetical protein [Paenibacillus sp. MMS18-CY102]MWC27709.1 hypothetical protein [Paenibacillus sp. MMS18-CY102]
MANPFMNGNRQLLEPFQWKLYVDAAHYLLSDLEGDVMLGLRTARDIECIQSKAYSSQTMEINGKTDTVYAVKVGDVWVGQLDDNSSLT